MNLRRGFKAEANWYSSDIRRSMRLAPESPLCPFQLAQHLEIPTLPLSYFKDIHQNEVEYFSGGKGQFEFSAVSLFMGRQPQIIYNDSHSIKRISSDVMHELSHFILLHPPKPPFDESGSRHYIDELEAEANWLGPALLISNEAARIIASQNISIKQASNIYNATEEVVKMRLNVTGAQIRQVRALRKQGG